MGYKGFNRRPQSANDRYTLEGLQRDSIRHVLRHDEFIPMQSCQPKNTRQGIQAAALSSRHHLHQS
ncbi:hypothetical protein WN944_000518 [Citrus x changshan-huyou]|uniref:Uncharacterized protein n=1 Tax=Citrus x changshan-huyou TaxID=2935761 RepID=A0AAP0QM01_9ROSI